MFFLTQPQIRDEQFPLQPQLDFSMLSLTIADEVRGTVLWFATSGFFKVPICFLKILISSCIIFTCSSNLAISIRLSKLSVCIPMFFELLKN